MNISKITKITFASIIALCFVAETASAEQGRIKARGNNGAVAAGAYNGNAWARGHAVKANGDGSYTAGNGQAFKTNNGGQFKRGSTTTYNPDGSVYHKGGLSGSNANGSVNSSGSATKDASGYVSGSRNTNATNNVTGNSYNGSTTYNSNDGVTHTATCMDANGNVITCPTR